MKLKATNESDKQMETHGHEQWVSGYQREVGEVGTSKGGQIFGDQRKFNFRW